MSLRHQCRWVVLGSSVAGLLGVVNQTPVCAQQSLSRALESEAVRSAIEFIDAHEIRAAEFLREIGAIESPSGSEHDRAAAVAARMRAIGLSRVSLDEAPNVVGIIPGRSGRAVVFVSTLDDLATVAEHQRAVPSPPKIEGRRVVGPGTNTSVTTAALLAAAEALLEAGVQPEHDLVFAAVAQEETGLVGMKALYEVYRDRAVSFVDVLGDGHSISYGAISIHWWRVVAQGPPGHTLSGGLPNVNLGISRAVDRILSLPSASNTDDTRTRLNVAMLQSGAVFNHKPESGWFSVDIRSLDAAAVEGIESEIRSILEAVAAETEIQLTMVPFQLTQGGQIPGARESTLVTTAVAISQHLGYEPNLSNGGSSNMNVAIAAGTPAIGLGGSRGGGRGTPDEWGDIDGMLRTAKAVALLAATIGGG